MLMENLTSSKKTTKIIKKLFLYIKHITFIIFLISGIVLFQGFTKIDYGMICFILFLIYSFISIIIFLIKPKESENILNNIVAIFLHIYFSFIAYKFLLVYNSFGIENSIYFKMNFIFSSVCLLVFSINNIIISKYK